MYYWKQQWRLVKTSVRMSLRKWCCDWCFVFTSIRGMCQRFQWWNGGPFIATSIPYVWGFVKDGAIEDVKMGRSPAVSTARFAKPVSDEEGSVWQWHNLDLLPKQHPGQWGYAGNFWAQGRIDCDGASCLPSLVLSCLIALLNFNNKYHVLSVYTAKNHFNLIKILCMPKHTVMIAWLQRFPQFLETSLMLSTSKGIIHSMFQRQRRS